MSIQADTPTISGQLADYAVRLTYDDLPADVLRLAHLVLLDTLGCGLAGASTEEMLRIRATVHELGGSGDGQLWGTHETASLPFAAMANGAAIHAREIDDFGGCAHSGSVVIPAVLDVAARVGASGKDLLTAIVIGYDVARRAMDGSGGYVAVKKCGWHSTSTCGGFGAAAAVGRLLKLSPLQMQWALGFAGSQASGTWAFIPDGAMSKRLHPGFAAQAGVVSAFLAKNQVTAPTQIFETPWGGFFPTYVGDKADPNSAVSGLGSDFRIRLVGCKPYAACRGIHSSIDIAIDLYRQGIQGHDIESVTVRSSAIHMIQLAKQAVSTMLDAQFSLPYGFAVAISTGGAMLDQYTAEALHRSDIAALCRRVTLVRDQSVEDGAEPYLDILTKDGRRLSCHVPVARGDYLNPLSDEEIRNKFNTAAALALSAREIERLASYVMDIEHVPNMRPLMAMLQPSKSAASPQRSPKATST